MAEDRATRLSQMVEREVRQTMGDLLMQTIVLRQMLELGPGEQQPQPNPQPPQPNPAREAPDPGPSPDIPPPSPTRSPVPDPARKSALNGGER